MSTDLEHALTAAAERARVRPDLARAVASRAARRRRARAARTASVVALCLAAALPAWHVLAPRLDPGRFEPAAADGAFLGWAPRGDLANDADFVRGAVAAWDGGDTAHTDVRVLYAGRSRTVDSVVVLEGNDPDGATRLAILTGPLLAPTASTGGAPPAPVVVRADRPAPDPATTRQVSLITRHLPGPAGYGSASLGDDLVLVAVAEPGAVVGKVAGAAWDTYSDGRAPAEALVVTRLPGVGNLANITVAVRKAGRTVWTGGPDGWSSADPERPPGGNVGTVEVWYLPPGYFPAGRPESIGVAGHDATRQAYRSGTDRIVVTVARAGDPAVFVEPGARTEPSSAHGGRPALLVRHGDGTSGFAWQESASVTVEVAASAGVPDIAPYNVTQGLIFRW
jgi:hypothetical protein